MRGLSVGWPVDIEDVVEALPGPVEEELGDLPGGELVAVLQDLVVLHTPHLEQTQHCLSGEGLEVLVLEFFFFVNFENLGMQI